MRGKCVLVQDGEEKVGCNFRLNKRAKVQRLHVRNLKFFDHLPRWLLTKRQSAGSTQYIHHGGR